MDNPEQWAHLDPTVIEETCRWFDEQNGRVGVGVLVAELRNGGRRPAARRRDLMAEQCAYADQIVAWLGQNLPDLNRHPAAVAEVIRLHWRYGKTQLTERDHGSQIRAAVVAWERNASDG